MTDSTTVPISQTSDGRNDSNADAKGDATGDVTNQVTSAGGTYGQIGYSVDNSVAPVEVVFAPTINKAASGQQARQTATQSGDTPLMTALKLAIPIAGAILIYYVTKGKQPIGGVSYEYW